MEVAGKRKASDSVDARDSKEKKKRQWQTPRRKAAQEGNAIQPGDAGVWATCDKGREAKCIGQLRDLFQEYAEKLYSDDPAVMGAAEVEGEGAEAGDIESEIQDEVNGMQKPRGKVLFTNVRIDVQCVLFLKVQDPIDPVALVHTICRDALQTGKTRARFVKRLTPVTRMGKATEEGLEELAKEVLEPYFHAEGTEPKAFRIQYTGRNHNKILTRDIAIKLVASMVGEPHNVNLDHPDVTIIVEVYKFSVGMSVVGKDFDELKRFNIGEICFPAAARENRPRPSESPLPGAAQA